MKPRRQQAQTRAQAKSVALYRSQWTTEEKKQLLNLHRQGLSDCAIANRLQRSLWMTRKFRRALGLACNDPKRSGPPKGYRLPTMRDPEVLRDCQHCRGPIYMDEGGSVCPDCRLAVQQIHEAHALERQRRRETAEQGVRFPCYHGRVVIGNRLADRDPGDRELMRGLLYG